MGRYCRELQDSPDTSTHQQNRLRQAHGQEATDRHAADTIACAAHLVNDRLDADAVDATYYPPPKLPAEPSLLVVPLSLRSAPSAQLVTPKDDNQLSRLQYTLGWIAWLGHPPHDLITQYRAILHPATAIITRDARLSTGPVYPKRLPPS